MMKPKLMDPRAKLNQIPDQQNYTDDSGDLRFPAEFANFVIYAPLFRHVQYVHGHIVLQIRLKSPIRTEGLIMVRDLVTQDY